MAFVCIVNADNVPVVIYQRTKPMSNTVTVGQTLKSDKFLEKLATINEKFDVNIITVDELNSEDLRGLLNENLENVHYEPAVESAYPTLKSFVDKSKIIKIKIDDYKMDVAKAIRAFKAKLVDAEVVILTALKTREVSAVISKRAADDTDIMVSQNEATPNQVFGKGCSAIFDSIYLVDNSEEAKRNIRLPLNVETSKFECEESSSVLTLTIAQNQTILGGKVSEVTLKLSKTQNARYWALESGSVVTSEGSYGVSYLGAPYGMETPNKFSFVCTRTYFQLFNATTDKKPLAKVAMYIAGLQIQPYGVEGNETEGYMFGRPNYCQGFFTSGIWMAIMSSLLLVFITMVGISFLGSINTMDRFDDPKGKPLNIALEK